MEQVWKSNQSFFLFSALSENRKTQTQRSTLAHISSDSHPSLSRATLAVYALALCVVSLTYSLITEHIWEDSFITLRSAENVVNGQGLTYHVGTRVHTFTSPINVLMLALCYALSGKGTYLATLWWYRVFSIVAFAGSGVLMLQAAARAVPRWSVSLWWLAVMYLFDAKSVVFSSNGMETAYMLLFVAWAAYLLSPPQPEKWVARGLCWAGLMWSRPDGCVYIGAFIIAEYLFSGSNRKLLVRSFAKSAVLGAVVYGPWFFWAWSYYGSPIPNTIIAKSNPDGAIAQFWKTLERFPERFLYEVAEVFRHVQTGLGFIVENSTAQLVSDLTTKFLGIFCATYWLFPVKDRLGRMFSFCFALICVYFCYQPRTSNWYLPPASLLGFLTIERAAANFMQGIALSKRRMLITNASVALLSALAVGQFAIFVLTTWEMKIQQSEIEWKTRAPVGTWLHEHGKPSDTVYLEPLGYIGYFSGMTMHDFPGLASPTVVRLRRQKHLDFQSLIPEVNPDWVVLRPYELQQLHASDVWPAFEARYEIVQTFTAKTALEKYAFLPGKSYMKADLAFGIFQRKRALQLPAQVDLQPGPSHL
jgi:hypothetical protein